MSDVNTSMPTAKEMAEANDYLKWKEKDNLRNMTSKYNNAVTRFHERIEQLEDNAEKVNQGTQQQFDELDEAFDGNNSTQWCCKQTDSMLGEYVGYDFQENIYPLTFEVYINNSNGSNPVFVFQGLNSNDEWVDLTEVTSLTTNGKVTITKDIDTVYLTENIDCIFFPVCKTQTPELMFMRLI